MFFQNKYSIVRAVCSLACKFYKRVRITSGIFLFTLVTLFLNGCYVEKFLPDENLIIQEEDEIVSYVNKDGEEVIITQPGLIYEEASLSTDTLTIIFSPAYNSFNKNITVDHKIPVREINSIKILYGRDKIRYGSFGMGGAGKGKPLFGAGFTYINKNIGGTLKITEFLYPSENLPSDYTGFFNNDNIFMISCMAGIGGFNDNKRNLWLGVEIGPAFVNCREEVRTPNPDYNSNSWFNLGKKYIRDINISNSIGLSYRAKLDWMLNTNAGLEFGVFGNINNSNSFAAIEFCLIFGKTGRSN